MRWGQNVALAADDIKRAALERVQLLATNKGLSAPQDLLTFMSMADVVYLDSRGEPVDFDRAIVTWNEDR